MDTGSVADCRREFMTEVMRPLMREPSEPRWFLNTVDTLFLHHDFAPSFVGTALFAAKSLFLSWFRLDDAARERVRVAFEGLLEPAADDLAETPIARLHSHLSRGLRELGEWGDDFAEVRTQLTHAETTRLRARLLAIVIREARGVVEG